MDIASLVARSRTRRRLPEPRFRALIRENAKLSQREVAAGLNVNVSTISRWESGQREPRDGKVLTAYVELLDRLASVK
ncbi:MAG: helix-turn-helix domain-containing protein [Chloroflexota bacterium]|nr:helix-turn-helix domain-containing protein [Chloroflexota bacterium]